MWLLIRSLRQKPADLDVVFSKKDKFEFSRTRLNMHAQLSNETMSTILV